MKQLILAVVIFGAGFLFGSGFLSPDAQGGNLKILRSPNSSFKYIKPIIGVDFPDQQDFPELDGLRSKINRFISEQSIMDKSLVASVYFRHLENGHWLGINENKPFSPGSLLKVPLMIAYLKMEEDRPGTLDKKIYYDSDGAVRDMVHNPLKSSLASGKYYTVQNLIRAMIVSSDNMAKDLLFQNISPAYLYEVFGDIGIPLPESEEYGISAKLFASFFRRLHNATFLDWPTSEKAMALLSESDFVDGIMAGLPDGIKAAHKYGERGVYENDKLVGVELHDCGVIYYPGHSYLLCIMTRSASVAFSENILKTISRIVYDGMGELVK